MTLKKSGKLLEICCDHPGCNWCFNERFYPSKIRFNVRMAEREGWEAVKTSSGWHHYCPEHTIANEGG